MAKRFIDTDIFKKRSVRALEAPYKLLFVYLFTDCNHAGIWEVDLEVAQIRLGFKFPEKETIAKLGDCIEVLNGGSKWYLNGFVEFQYGELNESNRAHKSVIDILKKYGINEGAYKPLTRPLQGCKDKDKDKDIDIVRSYYRGEYDKQEEGNQKVMYGEFINHLLRDNELGKPSAWIKLPQQVSFPQFVKLLTKAKSLDLLKEKLDAGINNPVKYLKGKQSVYLTLNNWL